MGMETAIGAFRKLGFPEGVLRVLEDVWTDQHRYILWDGHASPEVLRAGCAPQGDPIAPFVLNCWMAAGARIVNDRIKAWDQERTECQREEDSGRMSKIYMDDRSWADPDTSRLLKAVEIWQTWSISMGLKENADKTQLAAATKEGTAILKKAAEERGLGKYVVQDLEALGVMLTRKAGAKEQARVDAAQRTIQMLQVLPGSRNYKLRVGRALGLTKAMYGWIGKSPGKAQAAPVNKASMQISKTSQATNPALREVFEGGTNTLEITVLQRQLAMLGKRRSRKETTWDAQSTAAVREAMSSWQWKEVAPFHWRHDDLDTNLHIPESPERWAAVKKKAEHDLREAYRLQKWGTFLQGTRRSARMLEGTRYNPEQVRLARQHRGDDALRTYYVGGLLMPEVFKNRNTDFRTTCPWCGKDKGWTEHVLWQCRKRKFLIPKPKNKITARLGWPDPEMTKEQQNEIAEHISHTARTIWEQRYGSPLHNDEIPLAKKNRRAEKRRQEKKRKERLRKRKVELEVKVTPQYTVLKHKNAPTAMAKRKRERDAWKRQAKARTTHGEEGKLDNTSRKDQEKGKKRQKDEEKMGNEGPGKRARRNKWDKKLDSGKHKEDKG